MAHALSRSGGLSSTLVVMEGSDNGALGGGEGAHYRVYVFEDLRWRDMAVLL